MNVGLSIFLSVVLVLLVYNAGFRRVMKKIAFWSAGVGLLLGIVWGGFLAHESWQDSHPAVTLDMSTFKPGPPSNSSAPYQAAQLNDAERILGFKPRPPQEQAFERIAGEGLPKPDVFDCLAYEKHHPATWDKDYSQCSSQSK